MRLALALATMTHLAGCAGPGPSQTRARAAVDLQCPEEKVDVSDVGTGQSSTYLARGCGKRATYVWRDQPVLNSPIQDDTAKAP